MCLPLIDGEYTPTYLQVDGVYKCLCGQQRAGPSDDAIKLHVSVSGPVTPALLMSDDTIDV